MSAWAMQAPHLVTPTSIIASARTDRESKPYDHAAISNVLASKHNRHGRRNNQRRAYSMADRQSPLRRSLGSHSRDSRTRSRDHNPSNPRRSRSRSRRPGMRHSNRHIPLLRMQYRGEELKESAHPSACPSLLEGSRRGVINNVHTSMVFGLGRGFTCLTQRLVWPTRLLSRGLAPFRVIRSSQWLRP